MGTLNMAISKYDLDEFCECGGRFNLNDRVICMDCSSFNPKLNRGKVQSPISPNFVSTMSKEDLADQQDMRDERSA